MQYTFPGGIHPKENKFTAGIEIKEIKQPKKLVIPMGQHIGAPSKIIVSIGDEVKPHQKIGEKMDLVIQ